MGKAYLVIHGHFYQPNRIDPFTGDDYTEPEAAPFKNFNELVTYQCYGPNAELNNFQRMSFDLGPTLAQWLELRHPDVLNKIVEADRSVVQRFGYGNAMAAPFGHAILPLISKADKRLHVRWGILDFHARFGRAPDGMWLPETAVDLETLEVLAEEGIRFTLLAAWQLRAKPDVPTGPVAVRLPSGRFLHCFCFDPQLSKHLSFNPRVSESAPAFASLALPMRLDWKLEISGNDQLVLIATDGELYGHHQKFRDLFLADLLNHRAEEAGFTVSPLSLVHRLLPVQAEVEIEEMSSWSCFHRLGRWTGGCPCSPGHGWKGPFRLAMESLWHQVREVFRNEVGRLILDPENLLLQYPTVRGRPNSFASLAASLAKGSLSQSQLDLLERLCEAMYYRALSQGSDALFFDELSRLEPRYALAAAKRALRLVGEMVPGLEDDFIKRLSGATSITTGAKAVDIYVSLGPEGGDET